MTRVSGKTLVPPEDKDVHFVIATAHIVLARLAPERKLK